MKRGGTKQSTFQDVYLSRGIYWGDRNDDFRTNPDNSVTWVVMPGDSNLLRLFRWQGW